MTEVSRRELIASTATVGAMAVGLFESHAAQARETTGVTDPEDIVFVINASHGINAVLRSLFQLVLNTQTKTKHVDPTKYSKQDTVRGHRPDTHPSRLLFMYFNTAYPMV